MPYPGRELRSFSGLSSVISSRGPCPRATSTISGAGRGSAGSPVTLCHSFMYGAGRYSWAIKGVEGLGELPGRRGQAGGEAVAVGRAALNPRG